MLGGIVLLHSIKLNRLLLVSHIISTEASVEASVRSDRNLAAFAEVCMRLI